jgi:hypothetical protein
MLLINILYVNLRAEKRGEREGEGGREGERGRERESA